jgi:hypothetical protein
MLHGLIYQALAGRFTHGFDESNRDTSTIVFMSIFSSRSFMLHRVFAVYFLGSHKNGIHFFCLNAKIFTRFSGSLRA